MTISVKTAADRVTANAAAVATAMAGGTTTAEATALGVLLLLLSQRPAELIQVMKLGSTGALTQLTPT